MTSDEIINKILDDFEKYEGWEPVTNTGGDVVRFKKNNIHIRFNYYNDWHLYINYKYIRLYDFHRQRLGNLAEKKRTEELEKILNDLLSSAQL